MLLFALNDPALTENYTLSLHDALPICDHRGIAEIDRGMVQSEDRRRGQRDRDSGRDFQQVAAELGRVIRCSSRRKDRSEEHTSELQSQSNLVCRLLLEKKNHQAHPAAP